MHAVLAERRRAVLEDLPERLTGHRYESAEEGSLPGVAQARASQRADYAGQHRGVGTVHHIIDMRPVVDPEGVAGGIRQERGSDRQVEDARVPTAIRGKAPRHGHQEEGRAVADGPRADGLPAEARRIVVPPRVQPEAERGDLRGDDGCIEQAIGPGADVESSGVSSSCAYGTRTPVCGSRTWARLAGMRTTFHLVATDVWRDADPRAAYAAPSLADEGFIHCTDGEAELLATADRHYRDDPRSFVVLTVDLDAVGSPWRIEDARRIYPHVFGPIARQAILVVRRVLRAADGRFTAIGEASGDTPPG